MLVRGYFLAYIEWITIRVSSRPCEMSNVPNGRLFWYNITVLSWHVHMKGPLRYMSPYQPDLHCVSPHPPPPPPSPQPLCKSSVCIATICQMPMSYHALMSQYDWLYECWRQNLSQYMFLLPSRCGGLFKYCNYLLRFAFYSQFRRYTYLDSSTTFLTNLANVI